MSSPHDFQSLVSSIDYPMFIVTAYDGQETAGCLVGFATQASINPARMLVMISKENHTYRVAQRAAELVVHFLHAGNMELAKLFGEATGDEIDKFDRCAWAPTQHGTPVIEGTLGWAACRILARTDAGDHVAHLVEPTDAVLIKPDAQLGFQSVRMLRPGHPVS